MLLSGYTVGWEEGFVYTARAHGKKILHRSASSTANVTHLFSPLGRQYSWAYMKKKKRNYVGTIFTSGEIEECFPAVIGCCCRNVILFYFICLQ